ncbi:RDD family protein [Niabella beijingensis]|uniref:RDD family protein n=1 Tax=Niabella beijingensis TaxID=2872700 RepID=UPI001CBBA739|nr:RDD family protein [Niabella beijingensis]MBZ4188681.1 RDD family protein [Niabella beijingensis]
MEERYPQVVDRIQSSIIDLLFIVLLMFIAAGILDRYQQVPDWVRMMLFVSLFILYEPVCITLGCTLGNYIKGIRVRSYADVSKRINLFRSFIRYPVKLLLGLISFLTIGTNPKRRAIHDLVSGSVMIRLQPGS